MAKISILGAWAEYVFWTTPSTALATSQRKYLARSFLPESAATAAAGPSAGRDRVPVPRPRDCSRSRACLSIEWSEYVCKLGTSLRRARTRALLGQGPANACALKVDAYGQPPDPCANTSATN
jgi:hypothetical protein